MQGVITRGFYSSQSKPLLLGAFALAFLIYIAFASQLALAISTCDNLIIENGTYNLTANVSSAGTCFNILANNIVLDGNGFWVNYSNSTTGYAINATNRNNITIKNLNIVQGSASVYDYYGVDIYAIHGSGMSNSTITNNTITNSGNHSYGIVLVSSSNSNITNNTITTSNANSPGIYLAVSDRNIFSNNTITSSGTSGYGIRLDYLNDLNTLSNNVITTSGDSGAGISIDAGSNSNTVLNNTITTSGTNGFGILIQVSSANNLSGNKLNTSRTNGINILGLSANDFNHTIDISNLAEGLPIVYYFNASNTILQSQNYTNTYGQIIFAWARNVTINNVTMSNDGFSFFSINDSMLSNSAITTGKGFGIVLYSMSKNNTISNNTITVSGTDANGITLASWADSNNILNNTVVVSGSNGYGILVDSSSSNNITGGSVISSSSYDYYLTTAGSTNNFTGTNFTAARKIYFADTTSYFNYNNQTSGLLWLKTSISAASYLNRTLSTWSNSTMSWNDTNSTPGLIANYIITGLSSGAKYAVFNSSAGNQSNPYNLTADSSGNLQAFTIALNGNTGINVTDIFPPAISFVSPTWANNSAIPENWTVINVTLSETGSAAWINWTNNTGSSYNLTMSGSGKTFNLNVTTTTNATYFVYANDSLGNMNTSETRFVKFNTPNSPQYSSVTHNSTQKNSSTLFSASWTDIVGLAGYIFSTNNSNGTWRNYTYSFSGLTNTSSITLTLNGTSATAVAYIFYANNTYGRWNDTGIQTLTVSCTEVWTYSDWSTCSSGSQSRTGTDAHACGTTHNGTTSQSRSCTDNTTTPGSQGGTNQPISSFAAFPNDVVTKIKINLKVALTGPSVAVSKLTAAPASVSTPVEKVYQYLSITKSGFIDVNIDNATIEFSVLKSWMTSNSLTNISLARYDGTKWNKLKTVFVSSTSDMNKYVAYTTAFSYFAILGEKAAATATAPPAATDNASAAGNTTQNITAAGNATLESQAPPPAVPKTGQIFSLWTVAGIAVAVLLSAAAYIISKKGVGGLSGLLPKKEGGGIPGKNNAPTPWSIPTERKPDLPKKAAPSPVPVDNDTERRKKTFYSYQGS